MSRRGVVVWLAVCLAVGCDVGLDHHRRSGELGNGSFYYLCVDDTDAACNDGGYATFPDAIGVDGRFALQFGGFERALGTIEPASPTFIVTDGDELVAKRVGVVALLARDAADAHVLDFIHVPIAQPRSLHVLASLGEGDAGLFGSLRVGTSIRLSAFPISEQGVLLGGTRPRYDWSSSDESILEVDGDPAGLGAVAWAHAPGMVVVVARSGDLTGELEVTVDAPDSGAVVPLDAGPSASTDAGDEDAGHTSGDLDGGR